MNLEQLVNAAVIHGDKIQERGLGTIIASESTLRKADAFADSQANKRDNAAQKLVAGLLRKTVGGEVRYYKADTLFAIVSRAGGLRPHR